MNTDTRKRSPESAPQQSKGPQEEGMKINGLQQVIDMLRHADPQFRASLIRRIQAKDPKLAQNLLRMIT